jgi:hypothetical protein
VEKREINIPLEIQEQAVKLDEDVFHVVALAVGPWQQRLSELGGVKPLAFGQYGELGPGLEELLDTIAEAGAEWYIISHHLAAKNVQLRLVRQRMVW